MLGVRNPDLAPDAPVLVKWSYHNKSWEAKAQGLASVPERSTYSLCIFLHVIAKGTVTTSCQGLDAMKIRKEVDNQRRDRPMHLTAPALESPGVKGTERTRIT